MSMPWVYPYQPNTYVDANTGESHKRSLACKLGYFILLLVVLVIVVVCILLLLYEVSWIGYPFAWIYPAGGPSSSSLPPSFILSNGTGTVPKVLDELTSPPYIALSLNRLYQDSTRCMQIQRSIDNDLYTVGFTSEDFVDANSIISFCQESEYCYITIWYDQSPSGFHLYQTDVSNAPLITYRGQFLGYNNIPTIRFNENSLSYTELSENITASFKVGFVSAVVSRDSGNAGPLLADSANSFWGSTAGELFWTGCNSMWICGAANQVWMNGSSTTANLWPYGQTTITVLPSTAVQDIQGSNWNNLGLDANNNNFAGNWWELIVWDSISNADIATMHTYLNNTW
jgi:hypothetical protein